MKKILAGLVFGFCIALNCFGATWPAVSPVGYWKLSTFQVPSGLPATTQMVCFNADNTWTSSSQLQWTGGWFGDVNNFQWYGSVPITQGGNTFNVATAGMGQVVNPTTMSGNYAEWSSPGSLPLSWDRHFTYLMVYQGATCANQ